jgi:hypothetical protein
VGRDAAGLQRHTRWEAQIGVPRETIRANDVRKRYRQTDDREVKVACLQTLDEPRRNIFDELNFHLRVPRLKARNLRGQPVRYHRRNGGDCQPSAHASGPLSRSLRLPRI